MIICRTVVVRADRSTTLEPAARRLVILIDLKNIVELDLSLIELTKIVIPFTHVKKATNTVYILGVLIGKSRVCADRIIKIV